MVPPPSRRVLIVDDDESIRRMVCRLLTRENFEVDEARDGVEAIEKLDSGDYEVMVLDLMMPRIDGFQVVEYLRKNRPEMLEHTVVATAFDDTARSRLDAPCRVVPKPFDIAELMLTVRRCANS